MGLQDSTYVHCTQVGAPLYNVIAATSGSASGSILGKRPQCDQASLSFLVDLMYQAPMLSTFISSCGYRWESSVQY